MREKLKSLIVLQTIDLKIHEMEQAKEGIPQRIAFLEEEVKKEEENLQAQRRELERLQKERRQKEKDLEEEVLRIQKIEARVFEIKTNKEYQAVMKEIENAKKINRQREEEILEILERLEEMQETLGKAEKILEVKQKEYQQQIAELKQKSASFEEEMADNIQLRETREKEIPSDLLRKYHRLLEKRQGVALARVANGVCQACNMNLRPQLYIELQKQEFLIICPNCSRILFWDNGSSGKAQET